MSTNINEIKSICRGTAATQLLLITIWLQWFQTGPEQNNSGYVSFCSWIFDSQAHSAPFPSPYHFTWCIGKSWVEQTGILSSWDIWQVFIGFLSAVLLMWAKDQKLGLF